MKRKIYKQVILSHFDSFFSSKQLLSSFHLPFLSDTRHHPTPVAPMKPARLRRSSLMGKSYGPGLICWKNCHGHFQKFQLMEHPHNLLGTLKIFHPSSPSIKISGRLGPPSLRVWHPGAEPGSCGKLSWNMGKTWKYRDWNWKCVDSWEGTICNQGLGWEWAFFCTRLSVGLYRKSQELAWCSNYPKQSFF